MAENILSNTRIEKQILKHPKLKPDDVHLGLVILGLRDEHSGLCDKEQGYIAKRCGHDRHWVKYHTKRLQEAGILVKVPDRTKDGKYTILRYYFLQDLAATESLAAMSNNKVILDDLLCIPVILSNKKCSWMKPLLEAASHPVF